MKSRYETKGLLPLAIGFFIIMISPKGPGINNPDLLLVVLGLAFVVSGCILLFRNRKSAKPDASASKPEAKESLKK